MAPKHFLVLNGPNLNMLGIRNPEVYGFQTLQDIEEMIAAYAEKKGVQVTFFQSNHEGDLIDRLHDAHTHYSGVIFNPGALAHYSYALRDAVEAILPPVVEVHLTDISAREDFRHVSVVAPVCAASVIGEGPRGYLDAMDFLLALFAAEERRS